MQDGVIFHGTVTAPNAWLAVDSLAAELHRLGAEATTIGPAAGDPDRLEVEFVHASVGHAARVLQAAQRACL